MCKVRNEYTMGGYYQEDQPRKCENLETETSGYDSLEEFGCHLEIEKTEHTPIVSAELSENPFTFLGLVSLKYSSYLY